LPLYTALIFLIFALLHSLTVSGVFKRAVAKLIGEARMRAFYRLGFTIFSVIITASAVYLIKTVPDSVIYAPPVWVSVPARLVQIAGVLMMAAAFRPFDARLFLGISQAREYLRTGRTAGDIEGIPEIPLVTAGVYGIVRHPMYLAGILIFLCEPVITENNIVLRALACAYFVWGSYIEDRRFAGGSGEEHRRYRERVPSLNPLSWLFKQENIDNARRL